MNLITENFIGEEMIDSQTAKNLILSLFNKLDLKISTEEEKELEITLEKEEKISTTTLKSLILDAIPASTCFKKAKYQDFNKKHCDNTDRVSCSLQLEKRKQFIKENYSTFSSSAWRIAFISNGKIILAKKNSSEIISCSLIDIPHPVIQLATNGLNYIYHHFMILDCYGFLWEYDWRDQLFMKKELIKSICATHTSSDKFVIHNESDMAFTLTRDQYIHLPVYVLMISMGSDHQLILTKNYNVWSKGKNNFGQLGFFTFVSVNEFKKIESEHKFISISCGENHSLLLSRFRNVYSCGDNRKGQLGITNKNKITNPTLVSDLHFISIIKCQPNSSSCIDIHGNLYRFGIGSSEQPIVKFHIPSSIVQIGHTTFDKRIVVQDINDDFWEILPRQICKLKFRNKLNLSDQDAKQEINIFEQVETLKSQYVCIYTCFFTPFK